MAERVHVVASRFSEDELAKLDEWRKQYGMTRGAYVRRVVLERLPPSVPAINREAWRELARAAANLNQLARYLNEGGRLDVGVVLSELAEFRRRLIGVQYEGDAED